MEDVPGRSSSPAATASPLGLGLGLEEFEGLDETVLALLDVGGGDPGIEPVLPLQVQVQLPLHWPGTWG